MPLRKAVVYHNSHCSKSNAALDLLRDQRIEFDVVHYLETPLSEDAISVLLSQLGIEARALIRFSEPLAEELGISPTDTRTSEEWIGFMARYPVLIERPIVQVGEKAVIGRPLERISGLLEPP